MRCSQCQADNRVGRQFCAKCGAGLTVQCECGYANESDEYFCGGCGKALSATAEMARAKAADPERRQLTILFCDMVDSTGHAERLDPEQMHAFLIDYQNACSTVVQSYGGHVGRYVGDGLVVYFGYPQAHENDPQRAVHAGLGIAEAIKTLNATYSNSDINVAVRIGIATGLVVAGDVGAGSERHEEKAIVGETPNRASRLQDIAQPNTVVVDPSTRHLIDGLFDYDDLGPQRLKGISQPVTAYRVRGASGESMRARTPFVGRHHELHELSSAIATCKATGKGLAIYLRGEVGIGKTRLVQECAILASREGFAVHLGTVLDFGVDKGSDPIRALVHSLLDVSLASDQQVRQVAVERALAEYLVAPERRVFLNDFLDLPQSSDSRSLYEAMGNSVRNQGKREVVIELVKAVSARGPILIAVEDVHSADALTLTYLAAITSVVYDCPAALLMTSRIEGDPLDHAWRRSICGGPLLTIDLAPLRKHEAIALANVFIDSTRHFMLECVKRADGNPLFLEQLLRHARESDADSVPPTIQSLVLARMDNLPSTDRYSLQVASVIGQRFSLVALQFLLRDRAYDCAALVARDFLRPVDEDYLFVHALIREAVYDSLLRVRKGELHLRLSAWFAERAPGLHAQHLARAGDDAAPQAFIRAARLEIADFHHEQALELVERGLEIVTNDIERHTLVSMQGKLLRDLGFIAQSIEAYRKAANAAGDDVQRCTAWIGMARGLRIRDDYDDAFEMLDRAHAVASNHDLKDELTWICHLRGSLYFPLGDIGRCLEQHELALAHAQHAGSPENEARALGGLGDAEYARGRAITASEHFQRQIALCKEHGFARLEVSNLPMAAHMRHWCNEFEGAVQDSLIAIDAAQRVGHTRTEMIAHRVMYCVLFDMAHFDRAEEHLRRERALAERLGAHRFQSLSLALEAQLKAHSGSHGQALDLLDQAIAICRTTGVGFSGPTVFGILALITKDPGVRQDSLREGEHLLKTGSVGHNYFRFYRYAMETSLRVNNWDEADRYATALEDYTQCEPLPWTDFCVARTRALVELGRGRRDDVAMHRLCHLRDDAKRVGFNAALTELEHAIEMNRLPVVDP